MSIVSQYIVRFKTRIKNLSIYMLASLIPMMVSMVANPFVAKNMAPTDYAITGYYMAFNTLLGPLVHFYLINYYTKKYFEFTEEERKKLRATIFKMLIFFSFLLFFVALLGIYVYKSFFNKESQLPFFPYAIMALLPLPLNGIFSLGLVDFRMTRDSKMFFRYSVSKGLMTTACLVLFVVLLKMGAFGYLGSTLLISFAIFLFLLFKNKEQLKIPFNKKFAKESIIFCWPLVLASMLTFFSNGYDKVLLERTGNVIALGIYSVGFSMANHLHVFSNSINDTFQPDIYESIVKQKFARCLRVVMVKLVLMSAVVGVFIVFAPFLVRILTAGRYVAATPFARILSIASITSMMYYSMSQITVALGYTSITLINKIVGSALSILSFSLLIPAYGAHGAAWGGVLSFFYFFLGNIIMVLIKYKWTHRNENRNTDISSTN